MSVLAPVAPARNQAQCEPVEHPVPHGYCYQCRHVSADHTCHGPAQPLTLSRFVYRTCAALVNRLEADGVARHAAARVCRELAEWADYVERVDNWGAR